MKITSFGLTNIGRTREENQDTFHIDKDLGLYIVADGMGGLQDGARAAAYVVSALRKIIAARVSDVTKEQSKGIPAVLRAALQEVNASLSQATGGRSGSTVVVAHLEGNKAHLLNAGDSPAYLYRAGTLRCLTKEHNVAGILVEQGKLSAEEARKHPLRHQLTSYIGLEKGMYLYEITVTLEKEDRLLLCSDGLSGMIGENEIGRIVGKGPGIEGTVKELVATANKAGGEDNITAVMIEVN